MFLTATNVFPYLRDAGQASAEDVVGADFALTEIGRRNRNFRIVRSRAPSLFVKQVPAVHAETTNSVRREAACAQLAHEAPAGSALASVLPVLRRYDPVAHVLVYELIEPSESLAEFAARLGPPGPEFAARWAATLAGCHVETARPGALVRIAGALTGEPPWITMIAERPETIMPNLNGGRREVVESIRRTPELVAGLAAVRAGWRRLCLMHGDLKWDNVLLCGPPDGDRQLRLIDWELADLGEPLWDLAAGLCSFPTAWILQQPPDATLETLRSGLRAGYSGLRPAASAFWSTYLARAGAQIASGAHPMALTMARLAAARFTLLCFELLPDARAITPQATLALELARFLLLDPARAMADLFGAISGEPAEPASLDHLGDQPWRLGRCR